MTNLKSFFKQVSLLALLSLLTFAVSCDKEDVNDFNPFNEDNTSTANYQGLTHTALGEANLMIEGSGSNQSLIVDEIGESGEDGVQIELANSKSVDFFFEPVNLGNDGSFELEVLSSDLHEVYSGLRLSTEGDQKFLEIYPANGEYALLEAYHEGELVYSKEYSVSGKQEILPWIIGGIAGYVASHVDAHLEYSEKDGWSGGVSWNSKDNGGNSGGLDINTPVAIQFDGLTEAILVDKIMVSSPSDNQDTQQLKVNMKCKNLTEPLKIVEERIDIPAPIVDETSNGIAPWILEFGTADVLGLCHGTGFCNSTFPPVPGEYPVLAANQALVDNGNIENTPDHTLFHIPLIGNPLSEDVMNQMLSTQTFEAPNPFPIPFNYAKEVFAQADIELTEDLYIPAGSYEVEINSDETGVPVSASIICPCPFFVVGPPIIIIIIINF